MTPSPETLLAVEHLTMRFGGLVAISELSFDVRAGDITALIGPNGAGKTTVFNCITGFYRPTEGRLALRHGDAGIWSELDWLKDIFGPEFDPGQYRMLLFGFAMVVIMVFKPRGLISTRDPSVVLAERKAISGNLVGEGRG